MKCKDTRGLTVMPVFYDVDPSDVRKQKGDFGRGFTKQKIENTSKVELWRKALVCASEIAGWEPKNIANGHESKVIKEIVDTISDKLFSADSYVDEDLVGMSARLQELEAQLDIGSDGVRMVGVWGVGGGGKTTLASSLCMKISHRFQGHCIIENIREKSSKHGLESLQENLISRLLKKEMKLQSVEEGKHIIRSRLNHSNVLIVLDDVNDGEQLDALVGSHKWFGSGSRIVITTRDEHVLRAHKVDHVCPVTLLSKEEAIMLFNKHAYNKDNLVKDYEKLSLHVVSYSNGLPLALKVLGSFLYDKDEKEWTSSLARLKDIPEMEILEKLKISYDGLKNVEKELFLDIACFFRGKSIKTYYPNLDAMEVFDACGYHPDIGIKVLSQKALITIVDGTFDMHDLIQEMGYYIVRGEHPNNPEWHSRVWKDEEIRNMFLENGIMENNKIEAIKFAAGLYDDGHLSPMCKIISNMKKLRWLDLWFIMNLNNKNAEGPDFLSNELQFIKWYGYPTSPFPDSFQPKRLAILRMTHSLQKQLWKDDKHLPYLKVLELIRMENLLRTPNFDGLPCLQELKLFDCEELQEIHPSLGKHTSLECVCVSYCEKLRTFPTIVHMGKLKTLEITNCHNSLEFPEIISKTKSLVELNLDNMGIDGLLSSIGYQCPNLVSINLTRCSYLKNKEVNFYGLKHLEELDLHRVRSELFSLQLVFPQLTHSLRKLDLTRCYLKDGEISSDICELSNLQELDLSCNDFTRLDFSLLQLTRLKILKLSDCELLVELPKLPSGLCILEADRCKALTTVGDCFTNCKWLCEVSIIAGGVITDGSRLLQSMLEWFWS
ncbi:TMV resistance protein N-like [Bidens hawaiensis]|uniref:TMV resistance protein N-like n=1 Tax=Bidens hawaiensis TaxID=980011 RepID=UPI00404B3605